MSVQGPIRLKWLEGLQFLAEDEKGHAVLIDSPEKGGSGIAFTPKQLLLTSVAACSAVDVVSILKKMRQDLRGLRVEVRGEQRQEYPRYFTRLWIKYLISGKVSPEAAQRAIKLSMEKYCSVGATVSGRAQLVTEFEIVP